ncbi:DUF1566 domain-containing protein [Vibrio sp. TH_r3]|uniref:Lcl domain-containing protein n=1 Tax=Vibrio sp. TH_r3 TaxID=3082084 RepID=UPI002952C64A|nr:DUF1566 domain-containing protein [Vibrio sp. TH_r3]MDV7103389.1 DUF1566 domain-containing protein [Vibrio sp. TH_r3]
MTNKVVWFKVNLSIVILAIGTLPVDVVAKPLNDVEPGINKPVVDLTYPIVDTNQSRCFSIAEPLEKCPAQGENNVGQDGQYQGFVASYTDNQDGTVTDNNTRLIWSQTVDINSDGKINIADKLSYQEAQAYVMQLNLAGYSDWRLPTIKELYSLILFDGEDPSGLNTQSSVSIIPFIDQSVFGFNSGDTQSGERLIDSQYVTSTKYVSTTMNGDDTVFGVNFIDGRIKGYGLKSRDGGAKKFYVLAVRSNIDYGINDFIDNGDQTVSDNATGLIWQKSDSGMAMNWPVALSYCENLTLANRTDWRLPNVKELQSIVDYSRSPDTTNSPSINSIFDSSSILNENDQLDYANYWSSTTHKNLKNGRNAAYIAFGRSLGFMQDHWIDVHGAGSQRSDPKVGNPSQYPTGHGPQGDAIRINNYVRCVTGGQATFVQSPKFIQRKGKVFSSIQMEGNGPHINKESPHTSSRLPSMGMSKLSQGSRPNRAMKPDDLFASMDTNNDGYLSQQELKGPLAKDFTKIDSNNDGLISKDEIPEPKNR